MTSPRTPLPERLLALATGVLVALSPSIGPFVALAALLGGRRGWRGSDGLWWLAAVLLALPWIASQHLSAGVLSALQVLAAWLLLRAAQDARRLFASSERLRDLGSGLLLGLFGLTVGGISGIESFTPDALTLLIRTFAWREHPTLFAHTAVVVAALVALTATHGLRRTLALAIGAASVLLSGALEAMIAWTLVMLAITVVQQSRRARAANLLLLGVMVVLVAGASSYLGLGRSGFLIDLEAPSQGVNLLQGSETAGGDWWHALNVEVSTGRTELAGSERTTFTLSKTSDRAWARLQQMARLDAGSYTLSVYLQAEAGSRPGLDIWGRLRTEAGEGDFNLYGVLRDGAWRTSSRGPLQLLNAQQLPVSEAEAAAGWQRVAMTVAYQGPTSEWYLGVTPDRLTGGRGHTTFAGLQLELGEVASPYTPAPAQRALDLRTARAHIWGDALTAIRSAPWNGWGPNGFPRALNNLDPEGSLQRLLPAHAHNLMLSLWVERGPLGVIAGVLLFAALLPSAWRRRDLPALAVLTAVVVLNLFDTSLLYGGVMYPLAILMGWRAAARPGTHVDVTPDDPLAPPDPWPRTTVGTRLGLAVGDASAAALGLFGASLLARGMGMELPSGGSHGYALVLWPLLMLREGLHPGYGLSPANELRKSVQAAVGAGLMVVLAALLVPNDFHLPPSIALLWALLTVPLLPLVRQGSKRLLRLLGVWGRPVVLIGDAHATLRLARKLTQRPLDGFTPVAIFSDNPHHQTANGAPPFLGGIPEALDYPRHSHVEDAIVALPQADGASLQALVDPLTRAYRRVQFIPNLATLPSHGVYASELDQTLTLELRSGLLEPSNLAAKRALDLTLVALAAVLLAPLTLLIALAIRLDSRGPALYSQWRLGQHGRMIRVWKFRSMVATADVALAQLLASDAAARAEWARHQKLRADPRVTRVGHFLRRTSLDELPQLWNVLRGDMSLVGPRPIVEAEAHHYGADLETFTAVPPGISGHWQVSGRSRVGYPERVEYDLYYVRNWSIWLDLVILARTVGVVVGREGAY